MLTPNKKWYGGTVLMQEGHIKKVPDLDVKGLPIKKVTVPKFIREYFKKVLNDDILTSEEMSLSRIVSRYKYLEDVITNSLLECNTEFLKPDKINNIDSYAMPYTQQSVRGTIIWNYLYPDNEITIPNKVNTIKTTLRTIDDIENADIPDDIKEKLIKLLTVEDENMTQYGATVICIPKSEEKFPEWIVKYLDIDTHVTDNMKPGKIMLESLGFKTVSINQNQIATNIINI